MTQRTLTEPTMTEPTDTAAPAPEPASAPAPSTAEAGPPVPLRLAVVGAGPVGLTLALLAAERLPQAHITVFDARPLDKDVSGDARTLALALGSVQLLERLGAWEAGTAAPIDEVRVSQQSFSPALLGLTGREPEVTIRAVDEAVPMLGAVLAYGAIVAPLQRVWLERCRREPDRLAVRFGMPVQSLVRRPASGPAGAEQVEVDAGVAEWFDLAVVAEGGVFAEQARKALTHDYQQTAWVGTVTMSGARPGVAVERFTRQGPVALLPLPTTPGSAPGSAPGRLRASLVWCAASRDDPVEPLNDAQRITVLNSLLPPDVGSVVAITPLKRFALGLNAERTLTDGPIVRIGNAAQTLHPVAGQGLNLGLRDAWELVDSLKRHGGDVATTLRRVEWKRAPDRWTLIATTDFLARSFTWQLPGAGLARGLGLAALQALGPVKSLVARQFMFGGR
jgi:2-octaprenyl-6-methoxyphenol hydroxylase